MFQQATPGTHRIEEQIADGDKVVIPAYIDREA